MTRLAAASAAALVLACALRAGALEDQTPAPGREYEGSALLTRIYFKPLPTRMPGAEGDSPDLVALGRRLFFERGLSVTRTQSCNDCHRLDGASNGADSTPTSKGAKGQAGRRNSPTVLNAGFQKVQFWDGRARDLPDQAKGPMLNPIEMGMRAAQDVVAFLASSEEYRRAFRAAFPGRRDPVTFDNAAAAIAAFERTLVAPARFDRYLGGRTDALTAEEQRGLQGFIAAGCPDCHNGALLGGGSLQRLGVYRPYSDDADLGRYEITRRPEDKSVFKVPMLRNVTATAPYFHDGRVADLREAIRLMAWLQLDLRLDPAQAGEIASFLHALEAPPRAYRVE